MSKNKERRGINPISEKGKGENVQETSPKKSHHDKTFKECEKAKKLMANDKDKSNKIHSS